MAADASRQQLEKMIDMLGDIPPMPAVATKILRVASSEFVQVAEVTRLIGVDPGLASKVLSTCNSAYYGLPHQVKTLSRAVALLGFKAVRNLVLVHSLPWKRSGTPTFAEQTIWTHSAACAIAGRLIATELGEVDPEEGLLGGLMHDAGRLAMNLMMPEEYERIMRAIYNREGSGTDLEQQKFGADHTVAGQIVLEKWNFPEELIAVARDHHLPPERLTPQVLVTRAADEMAHLMGYGVRKPKEPPMETPAGLAALGYALSDLSGLEERIETALEQGQDIFTLS